MLGVVAALVSLAAAGQVPFYLGSDDVVPLRTEDDFRRHVRRATRPALVEFYRPGCKFCETLKAAWLGLARSLSGHATVAAVNCADSPLCSRFGVRGVPSIRLFDASDAAPGAGAARRAARVLGRPLAKDAPRQRAEEKAGIEYSGPRDQKSMYAFVKRHYPSRVASLKTDAECASFLAADSGALRVVVLKRGSSAPSFAVRSLAVHFGDEARFAVADAASSAGARLLARLGVSAPGDGGDGDAGVVVLVDERGAASLFDGVFDPKAVRDHVDSVLDARIRRQSEAAAGDAEEHVEL